MSASLFDIMKFALIPVVATLLGGIVAAYRVPGDRARSFFQHFAAGVVFAALAGDTDSALLRNIGNNARCCSTPQNPYLFPTRVRSENLVECARAFRNRYELLPEITKDHQPLGVLLGFGVGVAVMLGVKQFSQRLERGGASGSVSLLAVSGIDVFIDGLLIGVGFAAGPRVGVLLTVALTLELLFLGVSVAANLGQSGAGRARTVGSVAALTLAVLAGAALGGSLLQGLAGFWLEVVLSFGAAALLYLVTEELLTEAHEVKETPLITSAFFAGFILLYLIELLT